MKIKLLIGMLSLSIISSVTFASGQLVSHSQHVPAGIQLIKTNATDTTPWAELTPAATSTNYSSYWIKVKKVKAKVGQMVHTHAVTFMKLGNNSDHAKLYTVKTVLCMADSPCTDTIDTYTIPAHDNMWIHPKYKFSKQFDHPIRGKFDVYLDVTPENGDNILVAQRASVTISA